MVVSSVLPTGEVAGPFGGQNTSEPSSPMTGGGGENNQNTEYGRRTTRTPSMGGKQPEHRAEKEQEMYRGAATRLVGKTKHVAERMRCLQN